MSIVQMFAEDNVMFGPKVPAEIDHYLQQAVKAHEDDPEKAEQLLWKAQRLDPRQLEVYIALYKFYFYKARLDEADQVTQLALKMCAEVGEFAEDWQQLDENSTDWNQPAGAARIYLYTLKALSFIRLRQERQEDAEQILNKLDQLDPDDQVGHSVLRQLAEGME